jgi:tRNA/rRNA methyltransferase
MKADLNHFCVVLNQPRYPENIGAAARCCRNMGIPCLAVVRPHRLDREKMLKMATREAADLIEAMQVHDDLKEALAPFGHCVGTTARTGRQRRPTDTPWVIAGELVRLSRRNHIALVFGSEKRGLSNADLRLCQSLVTIPSASFSSINLAQSIMILCYEVFKAECPPVVSQFKLATVRELEGMYQHLKEAFLATGFVHSQNPDYWTDYARRLLGRRELRSREVRLVRGFCRQILWAVGKVRDRQ